MNEVVPQVTVPVGEKGEWKIVQKAVPHDPLSQMRGVFNAGRYVPEGTYTILYQNGAVIMSDTPDERNDHYEPIVRAEGRCLVVGLGLGMVLNAMAMKEDVSHIDVVEISQDVLDLVADYYTQQFPGKIIFYQADIFEWAPPVERYNVVWFDIWNSLCTDNLDEMSTLHRKYGKRAGWKGSWGKEFLRRERRKEREEERYRLFVRRGCG